MRVTQQITQYSRATLTLQIPYIFNLSNWQHPLQKFANLAIRFLKSCHTGNFTCQNLPIQQVHCHSGNLFIQTLPIWQVQPQKLANLATLTELSCQSGKSETKNLPIWQVQPQNLPIWQVQPQKLANLASRNPETCQSGKSPLYMQ